MPYSPIPSGTNSDSMRNRGAEPCGLDGGIALLMTPQPSIVPRVLQPPSGWTVEQHDGYVSMSAPTLDAELRVTMVDLEKPGLTPSQWLAGVVRANRKLGRTLTAAEYGPFTGYSIDIVALGTRIRGWFLHSGLLPVVITYRSLESVGARDDPTVQAALETLLAGAAV